MNIYLGKEFNEKRFLRSDMRKRILEFAKDYDKLINNDLQTSMIKWLREGEYDVIRYFLNNSAAEYNLNFTLLDLSNMTVEDFYIRRQYARKKCELLEKKKELYNEYLTYYDI